MILLYKIYPASYLLFSIQTCNSLAGFVLFFLWTLFYFSIFIVTARYFSSPLVYLLGYADCRRGKIRSWQLFQPPKSVTWWIPQISSIPLSLLSLLCIPLLASGSHNAISFQLGMFSNTFMLFFPIPVFLLKLVLFGCVSLMHMSHSVYSGPILPWTLPSKVATSASRLGQGKVKPYPFLKIALFAFLRGSFGCFLGPMVAGNLPSWRYVKIHNIPFMLEGF